MICLNEEEIDYMRDTLTLLMAVHSRTMEPTAREAALEIFAADGAKTTESAQVVLLGRILKMAERFL